MLVEQGVKVVKSAYRDTNKIQKESIFIQDLGYKEYLDCTEA